MTEKKSTAKKVAPKKTATKKAEKVSLSVSVYDTKGKEVRKIDLPEALFGENRNDSLVHQVVVSMESNARTNVAHTKDRGDVRGGGKKPWKQKGTGRARHGSSRSPIWVGGGVTHGPTNDRNFSKKVNKKMSTKALAVALSSKLKDGEILFIDMPKFSEPKTKVAKDALNSLSKVAGFEMLSNRRNNSALLALSDADVNTARSFENMGNIGLTESRNLNPVSILSYKYLVIANPEESIDHLEKRMNPVKGNDVEGKAVKSNVGAKDTGPSNGMK